MSFLPVAFILLIRGNTAAAQTISFPQLQQSDFFTHIWPFFPLISNNDSTGTYQSRDYNSQDYFRKRINTVTCYGNNGGQYEGFPCDHENCIPLTWLCDGEKDCSSGTDEMNCYEQRCPPNKFQCVIRGSLTCISKDRVCDGIIDCQDGSDESFKEACASQNCHRQGKLQCSNGRGCISTTEKCDGHEDCSDGSDEINCSECRQQFEFQCYDRRCIPERWLCDGHNDCAKGEDEIYYNCREHNTLQRNFFGLPSI